MIDDINDCERSARSYNVKESSDSLLVDADNNNWLLYVTNSVRTGVD